MWLPSHFTLALVAVHITRALAFCPNSGARSASSSSALARTFLTLELQSFDFTSVNSAEARAARRAARANGQGNSNQLEPQPVPPQPTATFDDAAQATVRRAVDAAAASAAEALGDVDVTSAVVEGIIAGFSAKFREHLRPPASSGTAVPAEPMAAAPSTALQNAIDTATLTQVLLEFVDGQYARRMLEECRIQPRLGSPSIERIGAMFKAVRLGDAQGSAKLELQLHPVFEQRSEKLLEQLVKHLRPRLPELKRLQYSSNSPPSTRTIIIS